MTPAPPRHLILGTAGHVDHGKTELVRALTGHETDRLKEEKERGISIELGFAPLDLGGGLFVGIVDVPGHERFVKHMVSGAGGLDMALLLVAADEGVMPQTWEHMEVLRSLHIACGAVVISKCDLASEDTMPLLLEEIESLVGGSFLEDAPVVCTSARTGNGVDDLKEVLRALAAGVKGRPSSGAFRLAIDRVFHRQGIGVVVTGSCYSGSVRCGDALELLPGGRRIRVRELQSFGAKRDEGHAGQRLAVALQGVKLADVRRGQMIASPGSFAATTRVDARISVASYADFELKNRERVRIHHGACEALARVILLENDRIRSGESGLVQLKLESPIVPAVDDVFVLRKYSPARVAGGGRVIDPAPESHRRFDDEALERIRVREAGDPVSILSKTLERAGVVGIPAGPVEAGARDALCTGGEAVLIGANLVDAHALNQLGDRIGQVTTEHISKNPLQWGIDREELRRRVGFAGSVAQWTATLEALAKIRPVFSRGSRVRVGSREPELGRGVVDRIDALGAALEARGPSFATRADVESMWTGPEAVGDAVGFLRERGDVVELPGGGVIHSRALRDVERLLGRLFEKSEEIGVAEVKAALDLTRKHAIPLLEYFDAERVTLRRGNVRVRGPGFRSG